jgi:hypothetical protein
MLSKAVGDLVVEGLGGPSQSHSAPLSPEQRGLSHPAFYGDSRISLYLLAT